VYAFGGDGGAAGYLNDLWRYDPAADTWENLSLRSQSGALAPRELYNLSHDGRGGLYLFGGTNEYGRLNDFWRYDIAAGRWTDLTDATGSRAVPGRHYYGQACDAAGNFYVLGGWKTWSWADQSSGAVDDFWKYDAAAQSWARAEPLVTAGLLPRVPYAMVLMGGRLVGFGGAVPAAGGAEGELALVADTWSLELDGAFPRLPAAGEPFDPAPPPRLVIPVVTRPDRTRGRPRRRRR
jgi:hypothetical protein